MSNNEVNNSEQNYGGEKTISPQAGRDYIDSKTHQSQDKLSRFLDSRIPIGIGAAGTGAASLLLLKIAESMPTDIRLGAGLAVAGLSIGFLKLLWDKSRQLGGNKDRGKEISNGQ